MLNNELNKLASPNCYLRNRLTYFARNTLLKPFTGKRYLANFILRFQVLFDCIPLLEQCNVNVDEDLNSVPMYVK